MSSIEQQQQNQPAPSFRQMVCSILASFFGVQNSTNRRRDFTAGKAKHFFAVGVLMTVVWYSVIWLVVEVVLAK
jgi:hypothetical protein